jgi:hypothetical protein
MTDTATSIEALAREVAEYLRAHRPDLPALRNEAGELVGPGQLATGRLSVNPGDEIQSVWGNTTFDQTMQCYASAADRDAQWAAPHDGALAYTVDTGTGWLRKAGAWVGFTSRYPSTVARSTALTLPATASTWVIVPCNSVISDPGGLYNTTSGLYTCPIAGLYGIVAKVSVDNATTSRVGVGIYRNGAAVVTGGAHGSVSGPVMPTVSIYYQCSAGDTLAMWTYSTVASANLRGNPTENQFSVACLGI